MGHHAIVIGRGGSGVLVLGRAMVPIGGEVMIRVQPKPLPPIQAGDAPDHGPAILICLSAAIGIVLILTALALPS